MAELVKNYIGGQWVATGAAFDTTNPATEELIAPVAQAGVGEVDAAVKAAKAAYKEWRLVPAPRRDQDQCPRGPPRHGRPHPVVGLVSFASGKLPKINPMDICDVSSQTA